MFEGFCLAKCYVPCQFRAPCCDKAAQREETVFFGDFRLVNDLKTCLTCKQKYLISANTFTELEYLSISSTIA